LATYTSLDSLDLPAIAEQYGLTAPIAEPLQGGAANSSFLVESGEGRFVLTALDNHDVASARHLARIMRGFGDAGLSTAHVVANREGDEATGSSSRT
jgi:homoserine kinase type II